MTHKFSQSHFRIQTRSQTRREGPRSRRLTKTLLPSSRCPMGSYQSHRSSDGAQAEGGWVYARDTRQGLDRVCFSSWSGSNPRSTRYVHMPKKNRTGTRPWGPVSWTQTRVWRMSWSRHEYQIGCTFRGKPPVHDLSCHCWGCDYLTCKQSCTPHTEVS